jgi:hypothetical protein
MAVRSKLHLHGMEDHGDGSKTLHFSTQYDPAIPEDQRFCEATPSGQAQLLINNPAALAQFAVGNSYYVDFTPVPEASEASKSEPEGGAAAA